MTNKTTETKTLTWLESHPGALCAEVIRAGYSVDVLDELLARGLVRKSSIIAHRPNIRGWFVVE